MLRNEHKKNCKRELMKTESNENKKEQSTDCSFFIQYYIRLSFVLI